MKFEFCNKKKKSELTADMVLIAAAAGAIAAGCVIATYEALKTEKGQAAIAKTKAATVAAAGKVKATATVAAGKVKETAAVAAVKVKETAAVAADKVKATAVTAMDAVKAKLPKKEETCACGCGCGPDCDCGCQEGKECTCEGNCTCGCEETAQAFEATETPVEE